MQKHETKLKYYYRQQSSNIISIYGLIHLCEITDNAVKIYQQSGLFTPSKLNLLFFFLVTILARKSNELDRGKPKIITVQVALNLMGADGCLLWSDRSFAYFIGDYSRSTNTTLTCV